MPRRPATWHTNVWSGDFSSSAFARTCNASPAIMADNLGPLILGISWTETSVGLVFFALRFITNWKLIRRFR